MAEIIPQYVVEQKVVTVSNNDGAINTEIDTQAAEDPAWLVNNLFIYPSGASVIILFTRQTVSS
jgi:hypothetical protein